MEFPKKPNVFSSNQKKTLGIVGILIQFHREHHVLSPNKRIGMVISFELHVFPLIPIPIPKK
jgi:hypothetical protein